MYMCWVYWGFWSIDRSIHHHFVFDRPASRQDIDSLGRPKRGWGGGPRSSSSAAVGVSAAPVGMDLLVGTARPPSTTTTTTSIPTATEFEKAWRRLGSSSGVQRMDSLRSAGGAGFIRARLSRGELGPDLLGEMVEALATAGDDDDSQETVLACLDALAATPRFALHLALLSREQRSAGRELVAALVAGDGKGDGDERLARVRKAFA
jgi:hypothetical protein